MAKVTLSNSIESNKHWEILEHLLNKNIVNNSKNIHSDYVERLTSGLKSNVQVKIEDDGSSLEAKIVEKVNGFKFTCPNEEDIAPCICSITDSTTLNCSEVNNFLHLKQILNNAEFPSTKFDYFKYYPKTPNNNELLLLNNTFGPLSFTNIFIGQSGLRMMEQNALNGSQSTLKFLMLDANRELHTIPIETILSEFLNLQTLVIIKSKIYSLPKLTSSSLEYLDLNTNNIPNLKRDTFESLTSLITLDLSYNSIQEINPGLCFKSSSPLVYLNHNLLKEVYSFPCHQPFLLDESNNFLTTFSEEVYKPLLDVGSYVDISSNDINCMELGWVNNEPNYGENVISDC